MIRFIARHPVAVFLSILLHVILVVLLVFKWTEPDTIKVSVQGDEKKASPQTQAAEIRQIEPLQTFAVDASLVQEKLQKIKAKEEARKLETQMLEAKTSQERQRLKELQKRQKIEQEKADKATNMAAQQRAKTEAERRKTALERQKTEEAKRLAKLEKQKAEVERIKAKEAQQAAILADKKRLKSLEKAKLAEQVRLAEEKKKLALEKENAAKAKENEALKQAQDKARASATLQRQLDDEATALRTAKKRKQMLSLRESYISAISAKVRDNWRTPAKISAKAQCDLKITQTPKGSVTSVKVLNCNEFATKQFKEAAEKAVYRSEPIPAPPEKELFERVITFEFKP
ncbi:TolA protein [hydrothermal vent metagenome]|uniref:TolA protein n=1 Tax=hydrothermal vent metagenome TaxID=652676 RepID=A0A3B0WQF0_9ZZZZ